MMPICPRCGKEMYWSNDYDYGDDTDETFTDYSCSCGVGLTIPWKNYDEEEGEDDEKGQ